MPNHNSRTLSQPGLSPLQWSIIAAGVLAGLFFTVLALVRCQYGIDFSDESYYLNSIINPFPYKIVALPFGYIYHPLYLLLGDITLLRQANLLIFIAIAWSMSCVFLREFFNPPQPVPALAHYSLAFILACGVYSYLRIWLITPSYNSLNLQGVMLAITGLLLAQKTINRRSITGWMLIGMGGWLCFMGKSSSALLFAALLIPALILMRKWNWRLVWIPAIIFFACFCMIATVIAGSVEAYVQNYLWAAYEEGIFSAKYTSNNILRLDEFAPFHDRTKNIIILLSVAGVMAIMSLLALASNPRFVKLGLFVLLAIALLRMAMGITVIFAEDEMQSLHGEFYIGIPLGILIAVAIRRLFKAPTYFTRTGFVFFLLLMLTPYACAFGSSNNYWWSQSLAAIFWGLAGCLYLLQSSTPKQHINILLCFAIISQAFFLASAQSAMERPYRQESALRKQVDPVFIPRGGKLTVSHDAAQFITTLQSLAQKSGFRQGDVLIDYTGMMPGAALAIGARSPGRAWLNGYLPTSHAYVRLALGRVPCEDFAGAFILAPIGGEVYLTRDMLKPHGIEWERDLESVGSLPKAGVWHFERVDLFKPKRLFTDALQACKIARSL